MSASVFIYWGVSAIAIMALLIVVRAARLKWRVRFGDFGWRTMAVYAVIGGAAIAYAIDVTITKEIALPEALQQDMRLPLPARETQN